MPLVEATLAEVDVELPAPATGIARRVFSFPVVIAALLVVLAVLTVGNRFNDPDMWWHLKVGEIVWTTHTIPTSDVFSFTTNNHAWIPHEWLAEVTIFGAYRLGGYTGLMVWLCVLPSLLFVAAYVLCSLYSGNAKVALLGALTTSLFATVGLAIRPHLIGYLLLTLQLVVVHLGRTHDRRWFFCLPVIFAVWVNCHGSFVFGLAVLTVQLACSFTRWRAGLLISEPWERDARRGLAVGIALSLVALFVNPVGLQQVTYPFNVMFNQPTNLAAVSEWQAPTFTDARDLIFVGVAALVLMIPLFRRCELRLDELLLVAMAFGMAIRHGRMMFVFGILVAPVLCRLLADAWDRYDLARDRIAPNAVMLALVCCSVVFAFPTASDLQEQVQKGNPVKAVDFLRRSGLSGRMLNEYVYGGYLIWAAPERKVFIDGRTDIFDWTGVLPDYGAWATLQADSNLLLAKHGIDYCLLSRTSAMTKVLPLHGWTAVYSDDQAVVFRRPL